MYTGLEEDLMRTGLDGRGTTKIVSGAKIVYPVSDGTFVYWSVYGTNFYSTDGFIYRLRSGTTSPIEQLRGNVAAGAIAVNSTSFFWGDDSNDVLNQCTKDGSSTDTGLLSGSAIYAAVADDSSVWAGNLAGLSLINFEQSATVTITSALGLKVAGNQGSLAMDSTHVYSWFGSLSHFDTHLIQLSRPNLTNPVELAQATKGQSLLSVGGYVYFVDSGALYRVPVDNSASPKRVAGAVGTVSGMATSGSALYWTEQSSTPGNGTIKKLAVY